MPYKFSPLDTELQSINEKLDKIQSDSKIESKNPFDAANHVRIKQIHIAYARYSFDDSGCIFFIIRLHTIAAIQTSDTAITFPVYTASFSLINVSNCTPSALQMLCFPPESPIIYLQAPARAKYAGKESFMYNDLLKRLLEHSSGNNVDIRSFFSSTRDTQELRDSLKSLEDLGYINVIYSSGEIYDIDLLPLCVEYSKTL